MERVPILKRTSRKERFCALAGDPESRTGREGNGEESLDTGTWRSGDGFFGPRMGTTGTNGRGRRRRVWGQDHRDRPPPVRKPVRRADRSGGCFKRRAGKHGPIGPFTLFDGISQLSGWVPTIAIVSGPAFAGHASLAGFSDVVIATRGSSVGMGGPPMVEAALGKRLTTSELAGVEMHDITGGVDILVDDEHQAIAAARRYLGYYHDQPSGEHSGADIAELVPSEGPYDVRPVIAALVDAGSILELRPRFGPSVVTAFARIDGRSVGVLASQPAVDDGAIDENAATKIGRFVELCDAHEVPLVSLIDTPGCVIRWPAASVPDGCVPDGGGSGPDDGGSEVIEPGVSRWHTRVVQAQHHRTTALLSVQLRRGGGLGQMLMGGASGGRTVPLLRLAWPGVRLGGHDGYAAVHDHNVFDDVIHPAETRERISRMLGHLPPLAQRRQRPAKKHPIDTW